MCSYLQARCCQTGGETVGVPLSEAVAEAVDGLEAVVTTMVEATEAVPATSMVAAEKGATTTESALIPLYSILN
jgi:hypothetical protein